MNHQENCPKRVLKEKYNIEETAMDCTCKKKEGCCEECKSKPVEEPQGVMLCSGICKCHQAPKEAIHCFRGSHCFHGEAPCDCGEKEFGKKEEPEEWEKKLSKLLSEYKDNEDIYFPEDLWSLEGDIKQFIRQLLKAEKEKIIGEINKLHHYSESRSAELEISQEGYESGLEDVKKILANYRK